MKLLSSSDSAERPPGATLRASLDRLLSRGACLLRLGPELPVPIPLHECVVLRPHVVLWATACSPYGSTRPCVGRLEFDRWRRAGPGSDDGLVFSNGDSDHTCILPLETFSLPHARATRLRSDLDRHRVRAARDPIYARRWSQGFHRAADSV